MRALIISMFLLVGTGVHSSLFDEMVFKIGNDSIYLMQSKCTGKVLELIKDEYHNNFFKGTAYFKGKNLEICWTFYPSNTIYIHFENNDRGTLPIEVFELSHSL